MKPIQALISDLDDTLLTEALDLSERTIHTLMRMEAQGVYVVLASGRSAASIRPLAKKIQTKTPFIAANGAQIVDPMTGKTLVSNEIDVEVAREALAWLEAKEVYCQIYNDTDWFYAEPCELADNYGVSTGVIGKPVGKLSAFIHEKTPKVLGMAEPEHVKELIAEANQRFHGKLIATTSKPYFIEITSPLATKGQAVQRLSEMLGFTKETALCAGDSLNDLSMLRWCERPIAVANAREEVKEIAWRIAGDGRKDGLAILLDELIPPGGMTC